MASQNLNMNFPNEVTNNVDPQSHDSCEDGEHGDSSLLKSFYYRSLLGFGEATQFLQKMSYLNITESSTKGNLIDCTSTSYLCSDESTTSVLKLFSNESKLGNESKYYIGDMKGNFIGTFAFTDRMKTDKKILVKSRTGKYVGCINFVYGGNTSLDSFQIQDSSGQIVMYMHPVHISLQHFEFPIVHKDNGLVANIFYEGNSTVLTVAENLPVDLKLLLLPLMVLLMKIKLKKSRKRNH